MRSVETFIFEPFELDRSAGQLLKNGAPVHLPPQQFRVLEFLVVRAGTLVTREQLAAHLWQGDTFVDFNAGLNFCVNQLRAVLGDKAQSPSFIETVPRRGYRFVAAVTCRSGANAAPVQQPQARLHQWPRFAIALLIALGAGAGWPDRKIAGPLTSARLEAAELVERGTAQLSEQNLEGLRERAALLERAMTLDPTSASAAAGLSEALVELGRARAAPPSFLYSRARVLARHALELSPNLAVGHALVGRIALIHDWNWREAERRFTLAESLDGSDPRIRRWHSEFLSAAGRNAEAITAARAALLLDPASLSAQTRLGRAYLVAGNAEQARALCTSALATAPSFMPLRDCTFVAELQLGRPDRGVEIFVSFLDSTGRQAEAAEMRRVFARGGIAAICRWRVAQFERSYSGPRLTDEAVQIALLLGWANDRDGALAWLRRAADARLDSLVWVRTAPALRAFAGDPAFVALYQRVAPSLF